MKICFMSFLYGLFLPLISLSQWVESTQINTSVCTSNGKQSDVRLDGNGKHGAFLVWKDARQGSSNPDIYMQQLDSNGIELWNNNGIVLCNNTADQSTPNICTDMLDGAIVAWSDRRNNGERDIYAQRVGPNGNILWQNNGAPVATKVVREHNEKIASDGNGGAFIFWEQYDSLMGAWDIWGQHLNPNGQALWISSGIAASIIPGPLAFGDRLNVKLQKDGQGGVYVVWQDNRSLVDYDIYAQHLNSAGTRLWGEGGLVICNNIGTQTNPKIDPDSVHNGIYVAWADERSGLDYDIFAQSISFNGSTNWLANGLEICGAAGNQSAVDIVSTTSIGGLVLTWKDSRSGMTDIYAQKISPQGNLQWSTDGIPISLSPYSQINPNICSDGNGGVIITWQDSTSNDWDVKSQRVDPMGNILWQLNGVFVSNADDTQSHPKNIPDGKGGSIYAWQDKREGQYDIYAHHLNPFGQFVGLNDLQPSNNKLVIYPNPCQNLLTIESYTSIQSLSIINSIGSCVYNSSVPTTSKQCVDLTFLPSGIYLIQVNTLLESSTQLLIKQ